MFATAASTPTPFTYRRRQPEKTVLYQAIAQHWPKFLARAEEADRAVPAFVRREFDNYLDCGIIERGAIRLHCFSCGCDRLIALSCKGHLCPSCAARRMTETAADVVDNLLPNAPLRQWVQTVPVPLRYALAYDTELLSGVIRILVRAILRHLVTVAKQEFGLAAETKFQGGAFCVPQRFNSALALSPHLHVAAADGVWVLEPGAKEPVFRALRPPTRAEVAAVSWTVCERTVDLLRKQGKWQGDANAEEPLDTLADKEPLLSSLAQASLRGTLLFGANAGKRVMRFFGAAASTSRDTEHDDAEQNGAYGFNLHAGSRAAVSDKTRREMMCRYLLRPPLSNERLTRLPDGRYEVRLKSPWKDGTTAVVLEGTELVGRLVVLVPPPRVHTIRYFGVLAPRSSFRSSVVRPRADADDACAAHKIEPDEALGLSNRRTSRGRRLPWRELLRRAFAVDLQACPRCKKKGMQRIALISDPNVIRAMLACMAKKAADP